MDIVGKLLRIENDFKYVIVAMNYFIKLVKVVQLSNIGYREVIAFVQQHLICRFGVLKEIVVDNRAQFGSKNFRTFCLNWNIILDYSTPQYPQSNGQAESTNKTLVNMLKKKVGQVKAKWDDRLFDVLCAYRCMLKRATSDMPFELVYGCSAAQRSADQHNEVNDQPIVEWRPQRG